MPPPPFYAQGAGLAWNKISITNAQVVALGAVLTGNIQLFTLGANEILENIWVNVTSPGAGTSTLTMSAGKTGAAYTDCLVASDVKTAAVVLGILAAQRGIHMIGGDPHAFSSATYYAQFVSTVQNLSSVTGFAATVYYQTSVIP